ncbi:MAG: hypothetical protein KIG60_08170 [Caryophanon sp.]|nr:hypothetical protein [Caryophanon sp.]
MKKITLITFMLTVLLSFASISQASAQTVVGEKLWTVKMTLDISNESENLSKVQLVDDHGNTVPTTVKVNANNVKVLEVYGEQPLKNGDYTLKISQGFAAVDGSTLLEEVEKEFTVEGQTTTASLKGTWKTVYMYNGIPYEILATFTNGKVDIVAIDVTTQNQYKTEIPENYTIVNGQMAMKITDLNMNLNGQILFYNANKFKIQTEGGKEAFFVKQ